jgi:putative effector of murein hydrolase LrgA (UPF0299 family)
MMIDDCTKAKLKYNYLLVNNLNQLQIFFIRAIIGLFVAVVITRMFTGRIYIPYIAGLAIIMVGLAYFSEYLRNRKSR